MQPGNPETRRHYDYEGRPLSGEDMSGRAFGSLVGEFFDQARRLIRAELTLAKTELSQEMAKFKAGGAMVGVGGALLLIGGIAFMLFACAVLALVLPFWASALIVTGAFLAIGAGIASVGIKRIKALHAPTRTIQTLKEDGQWASKTFHSVKSQMHGHA